MNSPDPCLSQIDRTIEKLRRLTRIELQSDWRYCLDDANVVAPKLLPEWPIAELNERGYIVAPAGRALIWLVQKIVVPQRVQNYPTAGASLRLVMTWWAEDALIFSNTRLLQQGDLFDSSARILLTPSATPGEEFIVAVRLVTPGHDIGALMNSHCLYERVGEIDPGWVANELTVLQKYITAFEPERLETLASAIENIDWDALPDKEAFDRSLEEVRHRLYPLSETIRKRRIHSIGHAHLDMAWLWSAKETWEYARKTFESVLSLQQDFPNFIFCHTSGALYEWIEKNRPDLFDRIRQAVASQRWEIVGGMWIEPETNLVGGESLIRQLLYAQHYFFEKFGEIARVAWLPDSFGFCWQLPQIFKQSGIEYFVTGKLHWNDTTPFPHGFFWWRSPDGTQLLTLIAPPNLTGVMDTNPITMSDRAVKWEIQTGLKDALWLPGVGDRGGGPTRDMLEVHQRSCQSPFFPRMEFTRAIDYLERIDPQKGNNLELPVWNDELYLEFHRGCYTTHAEQKRFNRRCEELLYQAELWASLARIALHRGVPFSYPKEKLEEAWKKVLFNQFHDILPGTSIPEVFVEADRTWEEVEKTGTKILFQSLRAIASQILLPPPPKPNGKAIFVFNSLNWERSEVVVCHLCEDGCEIYNSDQERVPSQRTCEGTLLFLAKNIPAVGYRVFWLYREAVTRSDFSPILSREFILENEHLKVVIDPDTGDLSSVFDKINRKEILAGAGNQLQAFRDRGQYWDAWNIDPDYARHPLDKSELKSLRWMECGPIQWRVRAIRQLGCSEFCQDYILQIGSPLLKISNIVNWQENQVLVKAAFPLSIESNRTTYEIPCGAIERPTRPQTPAEKAKWEVPALHWAALDGDEFGVSLLNNCKYGYDSQPSLLRLTLLRAPKWPDPEADRGVHYFTYALYPYRGTWRSAKTVRKGYEFNLPLTVLSGESVDRDAPEHLPPAGRLLDLHGDNLVLIAFKPAEDCHDFVLRCYECHGESARLCLESDLKLTLDRPIDFLERASNTDETIGQSVELAPWKIASFKLKTTKPE